MRPQVRFLTDELIRSIIDEAKTVLSTVGVEIHNDKVVSMLLEHGAQKDATGLRMLINHALIEKALTAVPHSFQLFSSTGKETNDFTGNKVHFTPGSSALMYLDPETKQFRRPRTADYIKYVKVVDQLRYIASQSTAMIPEDVAEGVSDSYRLFLSLLFSEKPVVTGCFTIESFELMKNMLVAVRGSAKNLKEKPLAIFSCCPTSPLKWSDVTSQNVIDCAKYSIPVEFIAMPLAGFAAPVTLVGTLIQHTAETLSGIVISQSANPGTPVLYGGSPAIFDVRYETTPMGAIETMMIDCAYNEIGKFLGVPTQAYISLTDAKDLDAQAGLESGIGGVLAALSGINNMSGAGMIDFESCISIEKMVMDNEMCGMIYRMLDGITPKEDFPSVPRFQELLKEEHLLISKHTRKYLKEEHFFPGTVINRANQGRWVEEGSLTLEQRAVGRVAELVKSYEPASVPQDTRGELERLMEMEARKFGQEQLPGRNA